MERFLHIIIDEKENFKNTITTRLEGKYPILCWGTEHYKQILSQLHPDQLVCTWIHIRQYGSDSEELVVDDRLLGLEWAEVLEREFSSLKIYFVTSGKAERVAHITNGRTFLYRSINDAVKTGAVQLQKVSGILSSVILFDQSAVTHSEDNKISANGTLSNKKNKIFIGHGRSKLWQAIQLFLDNDLELETVYFEKESRTGDSIIRILDEFLNETVFAILIFTAEDELADGKFIARQNVIHEAGLFQGKLGFDKVIILKENISEEISNLAGLQCINFEGDKIETTFNEIRRNLKKNRIIS